MVVAFQKALIFSGRVHLIPRTLDHQRDPELNIVRAQNG